MEENNIFEGAGFGDKYVLKSCTEAVLTGFDSDGMAVLVPDGEELFVKYGRDGVCKQQDHDKYDVMFKRRKPDQRDMSFIIVHTEKSHSFIVNVEDADAAIELVAERGYTPVGYSSEWIPAGDSCDIENMMM